MSHKTYLFSFAIIAFALACLVPTLQLPSAEQVSTFVGPRLWPLALLIALLLFTAVLLISTLVADKKRGAMRRNEMPDTQHGERECHADTEVSLGTGWRLLERHRHWAVLAATVAYTVLMQFAGFLVATVVFAFCCTLLLGARGKSAIVTTTVTATVLGMVVFVYLLNIPLP
ncbi:hypothetical protein L861_09915 [Litchfieldella anticariensis FP35 = DSM 16096]|uniref:DUF1468 domain-containing protein n=1 Tax=Litchfieldella anticariensis (strain DSM 16096 / CECT 5854 / CIP 108499 / LMG 22089 / FP35) TaxID=1121939 RepID=S2KL34_LITA3|nr:tripartite tricarboxylate transporter TctB family protein [Halomonas anticariensis]EPC02650.1 hypothetical protein L861_09915 [Halomonas anticariensis FP35 = DSM 16096]